MMDDLGRKRVTILIQEERHTPPPPQKISLSSLFIDPPLENERRQNALTYLTLLNKSLFTKRLLTLVK
jgi:16S rRNA G966 N2-methylase RsmD